MVKTIVDEPCNHDKTENMTKSQTCRNSIVHHQRSPRPCALTMHILTDIAKYGLLGFLQRCPTQTIANY